MLQQLFINSNDAKIKQDDGSLKQYVMQFKQALMVNVGFKF
jgi:hypothetical protein